MSSRTVKAIGLGMVAFAVLTGTDAMAQQPPAPNPPPVAPSVSAKEILAAAPQVKISNGLVSATVLLPDVAKGFYRGTRFDWAGMISSLTHDGHEHYGLWFDRIGPDVRDYVFRDGLIVAAPNTAAVGPADAYDASGPLGWAEAAPGGTFVKIGVGVLRKPVDGANYSSFRNYDWVDHGKWAVVTKSDRVVFTQTVSDPVSGYGYVYTKELRLPSGQAVLEIRHSLKNIGAKPIATTTFNHNFLTLGGAPTQAGLAVSAAFPLKAGKPLKDVAMIDGQTLTYQRPLAAEEVFSTPIAVGEGASAYDISVRDPRGVGYSVKSDQTLSSLALWSIRSIVAFEPFVTLKVEPSQTTSWTYSYSYAVAKP